MGAEDPLFQRFGKEFPKGTVLFREGEPGKEMFVLQSGRVAISKKVRDVEKILATLGPGEFFGEMAIISNKPRNASAVVADDAKLLVIDPKTFEGMIRGNSEIAVRMIKKLSERLSEADAQIENLLLADPNSRVLHQILQVCQTRGRPTEEGIEIDFQVKDLPLLADLVVGRREKPVTIWASQECARTLRDNMFNNSLWPDFTKIPTAKNPVLRIRSFRAGSSFKIGRYQVQSIPVTHPVESCGFIVTDGDVSLAMSGDTGPTTKLWKVLNKARHLKAVL